MVREIIKAYVTPMVVSPICALEDVSTDEGDQEALMQSAKGQACEAELQKSDSDRERVKSDMNAGFAGHEFISWVAAIRCT